MPTEREAAQKAMQWFLQAEADVGLAEIRASKALEEATAARIALDSAREIHLAARRTLSEAAEELARSGAF